MEILLNSIYAVSLDV